MKHAKACQKLDGKVTFQQRSRAATCKWSRAKADPVGLAVYICLFIQAGQQLLITLARSGGVLVVLSDAQITKQTDGRDRGVPCSSACSKTLRPGSTSTSVALPARSVTDLTLCTCQAEIHVPPPSRRRRMRREPADSPAELFGDRLLALQQEGKIGGVLSFFLPILSSLYCFQPLIVQDMGVGRQCAELVVCSMENFTYG